MPVENHCLEESSKKENQTWAVDNQADDSVRNLLTSIVKGTSILTRMSNSVRNESDYLDVRGHLLSWQVWLAARQKALMVGKMVNVNKNLKKGRERSYDESD